MPSPFATVAKVVSVRIGMIDVLKKTKGAKRIRKLRRKNQTLLQVIRLKKNIRPDGVSFYGFCERPWNPGIHALVVKLTTLVVRGVPKGTSNLKINVPFQTALSLQRHKKLSIDQLYEVCNWSNRTTFTLPTCLPNT